MLCAKGSPQVLDEGALGQLLKQLITLVHMFIKADLSALQWPLCLEKGLTWSPRKDLTIAVECHRMCLSSHPLSGPECCEACLSSWQTGKAQPRAVKLLFQSHTAGRQRPSQLSPLPPQWSVHHADRKPTGQSYSQSLSTHATLILSFRAVS